MTEFSIKLAQKVIRCSTLFPTTKDFCADYLTEEKEDFSLIMSAEDILAERQRPCENINLFSDEYIETLALYRKIAENLIQYGTVLFHGSAVALDGEVYLFTARSGTGKTTHTRYWLEKFPERARVVNGDKPLIIIKEDGVKVCGTPWQGKENYGENIVLPLKAVCILTRDTYNHIEKVKASDEIETLLTQLYRPDSPEKLIKTIELLDILTKKIPIYKLGCTMSPESAAVSYMGMNS